MGSFQDEILKQESTSIAVQSDEEDDVWIKSDKYVWYDDYSDDKECSTVDGYKKVTVNPEQVSLTQESNSQLISFVMPRYNDGIDFATSVVISFHVVNANNKDYIRSAVNVSYNSTKIRFNFLLDEYCTSVKGILKFEIVASGSTSAGQYVWRTRPNSDISIIESLSGDGMDIVPTEGWETYIEYITNSVALAQSAANEAQSVLTQVNSTVATAKAELQGAVDTEIATALADYYDKDKIDDLLANFDLSDVYEAIESIDGLKDLSIEYDKEAGTATFKNGDEVIASYSTNPTDSWAETFKQEIQSKIDEGIESIDVSDKVYLKDEIDEKLETLDISDKTYTKEEVDNAIGKVSETVDFNSESIASMTRVVSNLSDKVEENEAGVKSYYATYNTADDASDEDKYKFSMWEVVGDDYDNPTEVSSFKILGGSGGQQSSSTIKITYITTTPVTVLVGGKAVIRYYYQSLDSSGIGIGGTATWKVGNTVVGTQTISSDTENEFDVSDYISLGTQKVLLSITDDNGSIGTRTWNVQKIDVRIESSFSDKYTYGIVPVSFTYTPYGSISKTVHFILDGVELDSVTTTSSGIPMSYSLPAQKHGAHLLEVYITALVNGATVETDHIYKDIIWYDSESTEPIIGCPYRYDYYGSYTARQYDTTNIPYVVYDSRTATPTVTLTVDGEVNSTLTLSTTSNTWSYKSDTVGEHVLVISCRDTSVEIRMNIEELGIDITPITANLEFDFNPVGLTNNSADRLWKYSGNPDVALSVSNNFDWQNGGYQLDDNGDRNFCIKAGTRAYINYNLFAKNPKQSGAEFKVIFKTENVRDNSTTFLSCLSTADSIAVGLQMNAHEAYIYSSTNNLYFPYSEEDIIEFEYNINSLNTDDSSATSIIMTYEDGVSGRPMIYDDSHRLYQYNAVPITIGSDDCDVHIYRMKAYSSALTDSNILSNFIADARDSDTMISRYDRNQIYDENNTLTPDAVAEACPNLRVIKIEAPHFTNDKKDYVKNTSMECIYKNGDSVLDNWKFINCYHAGRNIPCPLYMETYTYELRKKAGRLKC
jgi:hypothetical protein